MSPNVINKLNKPNIDIILSLGGLIFLKHPTANLTFPRSNIKKKV